MIVLLLYYALLAFMTGVVSGVIFTSVWQLTHRSQL